jgi:hypothetical protein
LSNTSDYLLWYQSIIDPIHNTLTYMAGGSASSSGSFIPVILQPMTEKLGKNNHTTWRVQVLATLCSARLDGYVIGWKRSKATRRSWWPTPSMKTGWQATNKYSASYLPLCPRRSRLESLWRPRRHKPGRSWKSSSPLKLGHVRSPRAWP